MSASLLDGQGKADLIAEMIDNVVNTIDRMMQEKGMPEGMPPTLLLSQGIVVNRVMHCALKKHGPQGVLLLTEMYRDYCDMTIEENEAGCAQ